MINWGNEEEIKVCAIEGKCSNCGKCCGLFIPVTRKEISKIKEYVKENNIQPEKRYDGENLELRCPFLDMKNHKCKVYPVRPYVCRDFICSRKDWEKRRNKYQLRADYNGISNNGKLINKGMYSMDELIYGDFSIHLRCLMEYAKDKNGNLFKENFIKILEFAGRLDLLDKIEINCEEE